jgi:sarcosine oxidase subunit alpha
MTPGDPPPLPPGLLTDPGQRLTFTFDGETIAAVAGQSIAAALHAAGVRVFSRSFKYHRPRGLFCVSGDCPNCLMEVDGRPSVRTCIEPVRAGQVVRSQHAWPALDLDFLGVIDRLDRFLPVGFYYKAFHKPRWLWPIFEHAVRHVAGLGRIDVEAAPHVEAAVEHLHAEVCVIGGGPAGMTAAAEAATAGAAVLLLERSSRLGGHLLYDAEEMSQIESFRDRIEGHTRIRVLCDTTVFGLYEGHLIGAFCGDRLYKVRARQVIVCTGSRQRPFIFHNNDLPGIFLGRGVQRLARLYGVRAGRRAVVLTDDGSGTALAEDLASLGIEIAAVVDTRSTPPSSGGSRWPVLRASVVVEARGRMQLHAVRVAPLGPGGSVDPQLVREIPCDLLCLAPRPQPAHELLLQGGLRSRCTDGAWRLDGNVPGLWAAGGAAGTFDLAAGVMEARLRGAEAAAALGYEPSRLEEYRREWSRHAERSQSGPGGGSVFLPLAREGERKRFVCLCEDVTEKDLRQTVDEGFDHVETLKRYSTVSMGACQGKMCGLAASEACARFTGQPPGAVGTTTSRPPAVPVEMAVLAAERRHSPVRRTALHHWHAAHGACWLDAGLWKRPESYGDPLAEVLAVRNGAGLIDVSTLGKIEVAGRDAAELLERIYLNRWADLKVGRVRYGVMCNEDGVLIDDGVAARLAPDRFYLTATTGNADAIFQWLELWKATWGLKVTVLHHTSALAAMNLAGPKARDILQRLTALDLSATAMPYMSYREGEVASVPSRLFRIGFVGELGYEIHCPASQAWHLWAALFDAGREFGLRPFGVEAQRVLRLEKGHLIIGQDTDALSYPLDAGLEGMVRFDKPFFHGREPLLRLRRMPPRSRLAGFRMVDSDRVPEEGCQVVDNHCPVGRVTSARFSPTLGYSLGLAWVPADRAAPGERFWIRSGGADVPVVVVRTPFYDPEGKRLKG